MKIEVRRFDSPDEVRTFEKGRLELVTVAGEVLGRASYEPGWKWSEHVGPAAGTKSCEVEHIVLVLSGRCAVRMDDGTERVLEPGDLAYVPPGHDSWVVGEEPYVSLHFLGAGEYAASKE
jgi:quercetin dioxygenase-like cupin family protein